MEENKNEIPIQETSITNVTTENMYRPIEEELRLQKLYLCHQEKISYSNTEEIEVHGTEEQRTEMYKDLAEYFGEITNPDTTAKNPFFKKADGKASMYAPLDEVLNTVRPVLSSHGFYMIQVPFTKTGQVSVKTILTHKSGASMSFPTLTIPIAKNDAQGVLSGLTYARRAAANPILGIHGEEDDDGNGVSGNNGGKKPQSKSATPKNEIPQSVVDKQKQIVSLCKELIAEGTDREVVNTTLEDVCGSKNPNSVKDLKLLESVYVALDEIRQNRKGE